MLRFYFYLFTLVISSHAFASEVDSLDNDVRSDLHRLADRVDEIFGTSRADNNKSSSTLRLTANETVENMKPDNPSFGVRFNMKLATLDRWASELKAWANRKWHHIEEELETSTGVAAKVAKKKAEEEAAQSKAKLATPVEKDPWRFSLEKKISVSLHPSFDARARVGKDFEVFSLLHTFVFEGGWTTSDLWISSLSFASSHHLAPKWILSFGNSVTYAISHRSFVTGHGPALAYLMGEHEALSFSFSMGTSVSDHDWSAQSYTVASGYRLETWHNQLYFTFNPYLSFPRDNRFHGEPGLNSSLELVF